jgi:pyruvate kinase
MPNTRQWSHRTKIVCTLGPATNTAPMIEHLIRAGMNVARLNLSHGTFEEHIQYIQMVRSAAKRLATSVAILMDLPGPKYRTGEMKGGSAVLKKGSEVTLTSRNILGDSQTVPLNFPTLSKDVKIGSTILVDDGAILLKVRDVQGKDVICRVIVGGTLTPRRGVVVPGMHISEPFLTPILRNNLDFVIQQKPDFIALSFVTEAQEIESVRNILKRQHSDIPLISKIERAEAVRNFSSILAASDGIMVARGDLGVEIPLKNVPLVQKDIIRRSNMACKAVITATQMLESMINLPMPTRAEVSDVANAIMDGTDAIMLSGETSIGKYPVQAVRMMFDIAGETEQHLPYERLLEERGVWLEHQTDEVISFSACNTAYWLKAAAIVAFTQSGSTARRVSKYRPRTPIIAITPDEDVAKRLILNWGVHAFHVPSLTSVDGLFNVGTNLSVELGVAKSGDLIIITGGLPIGIAGTTNLLKVQKVP